MYRRQLVHSQIPLSSRLRRSSAGRCKRLFSRPGDRGWINRFYLVANRPSKVSDAITETLVSAEGSIKLSPITRLQIRWRISHPFSMHLAFRSRCATKFCKPSTSCGNLVRSRRTQNELLTLVGITQVAASFFGSTFRCSGLSIPQKYLLRWPSGYWPPFSAINADIVYKDIASDFRAVSATGDAVER